MGRGKETVLVKQENCGTSSGKSEERTKKSLCVSLLEGQHHDPHLPQSEIQPPFPHEVCSFASVVKTTKIAELKTQFPAELDKISEVVRILVN